MPSFDLILTLAGGLAAALGAGYITHRAGLSPIVGYLFAGVLVGPYTPGYVADQHLAEQLAEVGVILLMFGVGLQFHLEELMAVRHVAVPGALVQSATATVLGAVGARMLGWDWASGIVFGIALSVASTVVLVRVLTDNRDLHTPSGHIAVGWLVVEDLLTVMVLVLMPAVFAPGGSAEFGTPLLATVAIAIVKVAVLAVFTIVVGGRVIPYLLHHIATTGSRELFTLGVLVIALGIAVGSAMLFGVSMALGAFLAGMVVGRSDFSVRAASDALPMRDAFAVLFFVSVGMLLDPAALMAAPGLLAMAVAIVLIGKPLAALLITTLFRYPLRVGLSVAVALAQIGEFSFIVTTVGGPLGVVREETANVVVAASLITITLNPILYRFINPLTIRLGQRGSAHAVAAAVSADAPQQQHQAIIVGYGPIGRTVARLLRENNIESTIIDLNIDTVRELNGSGTKALYGDAAHVATLTGAGVSRARSLILSVSGMTGVEETIRLSRSINPRIQILARTAYLREVPALKRAGADVVLSGEGEVALAFAEAILTPLGATPEQIDRERARVHAELG